MSEDKYTLRSFGLEVSSAWQADTSGRFEPYVGVAFNYMDADFQVNARYSRSSTERSCSRMASQSLLREG